MSVNLWSKLARPMIPGNMRLHPHLSGVSQIKLSALEQLPAEVIAMILASSNLEKKDVVAIGLCSSYFWLHVRSHIERQIRSEAAPWAGMELALLGTHLIDLPASFINDSLARSSVGPLHDFNEQGGARDYIWSTPILYTSPLSDIRDGWIKALRDQCGKFCHDVQSRLAYAQDIAGIDLPWALRNLDTFEYITCTCELTPDPSEDECLYTREATEQGRNAWQGYVTQNGKVLRWLRVDDVIVSRICWSKPPSAPGPRIDSQHIPKQGPWAGHRFDIVAFGSKEFSDTDGWTDITEQVVLAARDARQNNYDMKTRHKKLPVF
ncbi:MAG: hypothetical protein M1820_005309 [Bogoriella megaspora]|nr:MAG: hypothetical protein M1820_005309 [Bogoriella megaspora]